MPNERQRWAPTASFPVLNARLKRVVEVLDNNSRYDFKTASASATIVLTFPRTLFKVTTSGGSVTLTLPPASDSAGMRAEFKKMDAANTLTVQADGADLIDGAGSIAWTTQYSARSVVSDGSDWSVV